MLQRGIEVFAKITNNMTIVYIGQEGPTLIFKEQLRPTWSYAMVTMIGNFLKWNTFPKGYDLKSYCMRRYISETNIHN